MLDAQTFARFERLLAMPDPPDLVGRGFRETCPGEPGRRQTRLLPLLVAWAQRRCLAVDPEPVLGRAQREGMARSKVVAFGRHL